MINEFPFLGFTDGHGAVPHIHVRREEEPEATQVFPPRKGGSPRTRAGTAGVAIPAWLFEPHIKGAAEPKPLPPRLAVFVLSPFSVKRNKTVVDLGESAGSEIFKELHGTLATQFT